MDTRRGGEDGVEKCKVNVGEFAEKNLMFKSNENLLLGESHAKVN